MLYNLPPFMKKEGISEHLLILLMPCPPLMCIRFGLQFVMLTRIHSTYVCESVPGRRRDPRPDA